MRRCEDNIKMDMK